MEIPVLHCLFHSFALILTFKGLSYVHGYPWLIRFSKTDNQSDLATSICVRMLVIQNSLHLGVCPK